MKAIKLGFRKPMMPNSYAVSQGCPNKVLRPKFVRMKDSLPEKIWVNYYDGKKLVWNSNYPFFKKQFYLAPPPGERR
jgi:hypothetical protein